MNGLRCHWPFLCRVICYATIDAIIVMIVRSCESLRYTLIIIMTNCVGPQALLRLILLARPIRII